MEQLAKRIQENRTKKNYSQDDLALKIGVTRQAISKWERGEGLPDLYNVKKLSDAFGITVDELINSNERKSENSTSKWTLPHILMGIPSFVLLVGFPILFVVFISTIIRVLGGLFISMPQMYDLTFQMFIPVMILLDLYLLKYTYKLFVKKDFIRSKMTAITLYGVSIILYLLVLVTETVSDFSFIFLYLLGFVVIVSGLTGVILLKDSISVVLPTPINTIERLVTKIVHVLCIVFLSLVFLNFGKEMFLVKEVKYIDDYFIKSTSNDQFVIEFKEQSDGQFFYDIIIYKELPVSSNEVYIEVYLEDHLIVEGSMNNLGETIEVPSLPERSWSYNFDYEVISPNYTMLVPGLNIDETEIDNMTYVITYSDTDTSEVYYDNNDTHYRTFEVNYKSKYIWIWDYNKLKDE